MDYPLKPRQDSYGLSPRQTGTPTQALTQTALWSPYANLLNLGRNAVFYFQEPPDA